MTPKEKEDQRKAWLERNRHVLKMQSMAWDIVADMIDKEHPKQDVILLGELLIDIGKRFD